MAKALEDHIKHYLRNDVKKIDGMINPPAAWLSMILCKIQHDQGILSNKDTCFLEIGVFKGLFLALLEKGTEDYKFPIFGVDPFVLDQQDVKTVKAGLKKHGTKMNRLKLIETYSNKPETFVSKMKDRKIQLIHVDGSHKYPDVVSDMKLADSLLADDGIVIADDFPKQWQLEVLEAVIVYLHSDDAKLVPFAVAGTKLYLCRAHMAAKYQEQIIEYAYGNQDAGSCNQLVDHIENHEPWKTFQPLSGHKVLMF